MGMALSSAGSTFPLVTIHRERIKRDSCYVGRLVTRNQRSMTIQHISPDAEWEMKEKFRLADITLLEFGGVYETLLFKLAG